MRKTSFFCKKVLGAKRNGGVFNADYAKIY